jgi:hypothetical protein
MPELRILIFGGLGNQLFQYAAGVYLSRKWNWDLILYSASDDGSPQHPRAFQLDKFSIPYPVRPLRGLTRLVRSGRLQRLPCGDQVFRCLLGGQRLVESRPYTCDPLLESPPVRSPTWMVGYWQVAAYAEACSELLRQQLCFRESAAGRNAELLAEIQTQTNSVSLHIRRGDYTAVASGANILPLSYYEKAIAQLAQRIPDSHYYVFSDDIPWARTNLPKNLSITYVAHNDEHHGHEDLRLMAACRHHIIANSSFSWWGAWLGNHTACVTFAPSPWIGSCIPNELYVPLWHTLEY